MVPTLTMSFSMTRVLVGGPPTARVTAPGNRARGSSAHLEPDDGPETTRAPKASASGPLVHGEVRLIWLDQAARETDVSIRGPHGAA